MFTGENRKKGGWCARIGGTNDDAEKGFLGLRGEGIR